MKAGEINITFAEECISLTTTTAMIERLIGHFLYTRGQIEKPLDQLREEAVPATRTELQYDKRSTPYQNKGNIMFATPLAMQCGPATIHGDAVIPILTELVSDLNLKENSSQSSANPACISDTPVTTRFTDKPGQQRRVLGKLQQVSVPITPKLTLKQSKSRSSTCYLVEIMDQLQIQISRGWIVKQAIILIGSTVMSPKETFIIDLASLQCQESGYVDEKGKCMRKVMQCLFIDPFLSDLPTVLAPTNSHIVIKVDKSSVVASPSSFFVPKQRFYLCKRGYQFTLGLSTGTLPQEGLDDIFMAAPRPFKPVATSLSTPSTEKVRCPKDILDTIK